MNCPCCGGEMREGYLMAGVGNRDNVYWRPQTEGVRDWLKRHYSQSIRLTGGLFGKIEARYCPRCGKIILDGLVQEEE